MSNYQPNSTSTPQVMGVGLARLESELPCSRGVTLFGDVKRMIGDPRVSGQVVQGVAGYVAQRTAQNTLASIESNRGWIGRNLFVSRATQARDAAKVHQRAGTAGVAAGAGAMVAIAGLQWVLDRKDREKGAHRVRQIVGFAGRSPDGTIGLRAQTMIDRVLDGFALSRTIRNRITARPVPQSMSELENCAFPVDIRDAVASFAYHAKAYAVGGDAANREIVPILIRLGYGNGEAEHFTRNAHAEFLSEKSSLSYHYEVVRMAVGGISLHLGLPESTIRSACDQVLEFNPYDVVRAQNRQLVTRGINDGFRLATLGSGPISPGLSIATAAARAILGSSASPADVNNAFLALGQNSDLPMDQLRVWQNGGY